MAFSESENHGIDLLTEDDLSVYSVGISTGGAAEIRMAEHPKRTIVATTIDQAGLDYARGKIVGEGLSDRIELRLEDVSELLPYEQGYFDFIYARLVLHYLPKNSLEFALSGLHRILKTDGKLFIVVRSDTCAHATMADSTYDPVTGLTEYTETGLDGSALRLKRHFFSIAQLEGVVQKAGFSVEYTTRFDEQLYKDFSRTTLDTRTDNLIELLAIKKDL